MSGSFRPGARAYIIESNRTVREVCVKRISGQLCLVTFRSGGGIQIGKHRLFESRDAAQDHLAQLRGRQSRAHNYEHRYG